MEVRARGPFEYPLDRLKADQFEALVALLARTVDPRVVPVRNKDHGLDARLPDGRDNTLVGWQAKRFTRGIHWAQCRDSARRAIAFWQPVSLIFVFSRDLSASEQRKFQTDLASRFDATTFHFWSASDLQRLMRDTDEGRRAASWLFKNASDDREELLRAYALGGELSSPAQAAERQALIQEFMDRDPHVQYTTVSRSAGAPETPAADGTFLSVRVERGSQEVRFDATERYSGALRDLGARPTLHYADDVAGRRARETIERLAREGGRARIDEGLGTSLNPVPFGLRGLMPDRPMWGAVEVEARAVQPTDSETRRVAVVVAAEDSELGIVLVPAVAEDPRDVLMTGSAGGIELSLFGRAVGDGSVEPRLEWRYRLGEGTGLEQLLAARILLAACAGAAAEVKLANGDFLLRATIDPRSVPDVQELESRLQFLKFVTEAESWLGARLRPPAAPSNEDLASLQWLLSYIRRPRQTGHDFRAELQPGASVPEEAVAVVVRQQRFLRLFNQEVFAGTEQIAVPAAKAVHNIDGTWALVQAEDSEPIQLSLAKPGS